jgi:hypothetical protein
MVCTLSNSSTLTSPGVMTCLTMTSCGSRAISGRFRLWNSPSFIETTLVTAAKEIIAKQSALRGEIEVDVFDDNLLSKGSLASFTLKAGSCVDWRPASNMADKCIPDLVATLVLTDEDGEVRRATVRGTRGDWQLAK